MTLRRQFAFITVTVAFVFVVGGCQAKDETDWESVAARRPAPVVAAAGETAAVGTANADAADDPAIWRNAADPQRSLIVGTDKKAGLYVYDLSGEQRSFLNAGRVNNVDLAALTVNGRPFILVAASDRNDESNAKAALFRLDPERATLHPLGTIAAGTGEAYGICLWARGNGADAFVVLKDGTINQIAIDISGAAPSGQIVRSMKLGSQSEGCVVDPRTKTLYVAEEDVGIWKFDASREGRSEAMPVAKVDGRTLVADVEGLALAPKGEKAGWLIASSQGDNAYALFHLTDNAYVGRFRIGPGTLGAVSETDGIEVALGDFGPAYPEGLMVAQDGENGPRAQNFKLVPWRSIKSTLHLE